MVSRTVNVNSAKPAYLLASRLAKVFIGILLIRGITEYGDSTFLSNYLFYNSTILSLSFIIGLSSEELFIFLNKERDNINIHNIFLTHAAITLLLGCLIWPLIDREIKSNGVQMLLLILVVAFILEKSITGILVSKKNYSNIFILTILSNIFRCILLYLAIIYDNVTLFLLWYLIVGFLYYFAFQFNYGGGVEIKKIFEVKVYLRVLRGVLTTYFFYSLVRVAVLYFFRINLVSANQEIYTYFELHWSLVENYGSLFILFVSQIYLSEMESEQNDNIDDKKYLTKYLFPFTAGLIIFTLCRLVILQTLYGDAYLALSDEVLLSFPSLILKFSSMMFFHRLIRRIKWKIVIVALLQAVFVLSLPVMEISIEDLGLMLLVFNSLEFVLLGLLMLLTGYKKVFVRHGVYIAVLLSLFYIIVW
jgi:hypothetical protein